MRVRAARASSTSAVKRSPESDASGSTAISSMARLHVGQLRLQPGERLAEKPQLLEEPHDVRADPAWRTEVDDLHRHAPADPIEPADPLLHERRFPGKVEQHEAAAELEVAALASAFGGDEQARTIGFPETGDLRVAARRGQLLVEDARCELRAVG